MSMYLITKWFGTFLCDSDKIQKKMLCDKDKKSIVERLINIENNAILLEEKKFACGLDIIVNEKRLQPIGEYRPEDIWFKTFILEAEDFGFSQDLFQQVSIYLAKKRVNHLLSAKDLQIIQMVNALDDLIHTLNLLSERLHYWSAIPVPEENILPFKKLVSYVENEIYRLEKQIEKDMQNIAPNITILIGGLLGARLISLAGGLQKLAMMPASTVQILGAEKALFRFKKEGGKPPKHGVLYQHTLINKSNKKYRGRIARVLAAKIIIAAKADVFTKNDIAQNLVDDLNRRVQKIKKGK
ncbi:MAG: hypothetical protein R6V50_02800 [Thermoplasmatota archaeon]